MDIHCLIFTAAERERAQAWHDANDTDDVGTFATHKTTNEITAEFRHKWSETARLRKIAAEKLKHVPPCGLCGAAAGESCRKLGGGLERKDKL